MAVATAPGLQKLAQDDFSAGSFPLNERIPANGCEDIVNGILADDASVFRRGGSVYLGTLSATTALPFQNIWSGHVGVLGPVTVVSRREGSPISHEQFYRMLPGDTDFSVYSSVETVRPQRPTTFAGMLVYVTVPTGNLPGIAVNAWGGDVNGTSDIAFLTGQSITLTKDSKAIIGTGTTFTSLSPGSIVLDPNVNVAAIVESVQSNTAATLFRPWPGDTRTFTASFYHSLYVTVSKGPLTAGSNEVYASSLYDRMVYARGSRVSFTPGGNPFATTDTDYHEIPGGSSVIGLEPVRDAMMVFTTDGAYAIRGLAFNLTDAYGNPQQRLDHIAPELVLWDNRGIASWQGTIVVPAVDDVYLMDPQLRLIGGGMRKLYRSYVRAGYMTGIATVFQGRYVLPILDGASNWIDTLVCDLRTGAWTRWAGHGGTFRGITDIVADSLRQPRLYALGASASPRVLDLSSVLDPTAATKNDADGTTHQLQITTRTFSLGDLVKRQWRRLRARYELDDAASDNPTLTAEYATDRPGSSFTSISGTGVEGDQTYTWLVSKRARGIRFRLKSQGPSSLLRLRALEVFFRPTGRR